VLFRVRFVLEHERIRELVQTERVREQNRSAEKLNEDAATRPTGFGNRLL
jgi:hypothetical protein